MRIALLTLCIIGLFVCVYNLGRCNAEIRFIKIMQTMVANVNPNDGEFARGALWASDYVFKLFNK